jgi:hypothetical protein
MRIDFVGNSHLGTIAPALTKARGDHEVAHFISRTYGSVDAVVVSDRGAVELPFIQLEDPPRYGVEIDVRRSDAVVAVGLNFSLVQMVKLWQSFAPVDSFGDYGVPSLSDAVWNAYVDAAFDQIFMTRLTRLLVEADAQQVIVIPQPSPAEWVSSRDGEKFALYGQLSSSGDWDRARADFARQVRRLESMGVRVFPQPRTTLTENGYTENTYAMGSPSDTAADSFYSRGDFYHMNRSFAAALASEFYGWLDELGPSQTSESPMKAGS